MMIHFQFPIEINEKAIINFKESENNEKKNNNFKISIEELSNYFKLDKLKIVKLLYFNYDSLHHILYNLDNEIVLEKEEKNLSYIFYAASLIKNNPNIINFSFTKDLIIDITNKKIENNNIYLELILSKAISDLIDAYKGLDEYNNNNGEIQEIEIINTNKIKDLIDKIIINKKNELKLNLNLSYIKTKTVDQIYIDIILGLLKNKSEDYKYIYNTITKMDLEAINVKKTMLEEIKNILDDEKNGIMKKYLISKPEDLFDENKISFFYLLLKYIFKSSIFIYQIQFFIKVRNILLELVNPKSDIFSRFKNKKIDQQIIDQFNYILDVMLNSKYYNNKYKLKDNNFKEGNSSNKSTEINTNSNSRITNTDSIKEKNSTDIYDSTYSSQTTLISSIQNRDTSEEEKDINNVINNSNDDNVKSNKEASNNDLNSPNQDSNSYSNINFLNNNNNNNNDGQKDITAQSSNCSNQNSKGSVNYIICKFSKKIGEHIISKKNALKKKKYTAEFITGINEIFISYGTNNEVIIYSNSYDIITSLETKDWIYNVIDYKSQNIKTLNFIGSSGKQIYTFT